MGLLIGQLAEKAGVGVETVRYYERQGLFERPKRTNSKFRRYESDSVVPIAAGLLYPCCGILGGSMIASPAMSLSSASVIANALRLRRLGL